MYGTDSYVSHHLVEFFRAENVWNVWKGDFLLAPGRFSVNENLVLF